MYLHDKFTSLSQQLNVFDILKISLKLHSKFNKTYNILIIKSKLHKFKLINVNICFNYQITSQEDVIDKFQEKKIGFCIMDVKLEIFKYPLLYYVNNMIKKKNRVGNNSGTR